MLADHGFMPVVNLPSAYKMTLAQFRWECSSQPLCILNNDVIQKTVVGIKSGHLFMTNFNNMGVAVTNCREKEELFKSIKKFDKHHHDNSAVSCYIHHEN